MGLRRGPVAPADRTTQQAAARRSHAADHRVRKSIWRDALLQPNVDLQIIIHQVRDETRARVRFTQQKEVCVFISKNLSPKLQFVCPQTNNSTTREE